MRLKILYLEHIQFRKKGWIHKTINHFSNVERYPTVIWACQHSTSAFKTLYIKIEIPCKNCKNQVTSESSSFTLCEELKCLREPEHQHSKHSVSIYSKKTNQRMKFMRHISDTMAITVHGLMSKWKSLPLLVKNEEKHRGTPEWTIFTFLYGVKVHKSSVLEKIKQCQRDFKKQEY